MKNNDLSFISFISETIITVPDFNCFKSLTSQLLNPKNKKDKIKFSPQFLKALKLYNSPQLQKAMNTQDKVKRLAKIRTQANLLKNKKSEEAKIVAESLMWAILNYRHKVNELNSGTMNFI